MTSETSPPLPESAKPPSKPRLTRMEQAEIGLIALAIAMVWLSTAELSWTTELRWLFGYSAALILGQGLVRDLARMAVSPRSKGPGRKFVCLCAESTLGIVLLVLGAGGLTLLGVEETRTLTQGMLAGLVGGLLALGFFAKDYVFSVRRETDHASIVIW